MMTTLDEIQDNLIRIFETRKDDLKKYDPAGISNIREEAIKVFREVGLPVTQMENWRNTDLMPALKKEYSQETEPGNKKIAAGELFECKVHDFDTTLLSLLNGWHVYTESPLMERPDGVIAGSLHEAMKAYPEIISKYYGQIFNLRQSGLAALNTALAQDGVFIYVPEGVEVEKPMQMINIINQNCFIQNRNLVVLGKNAKLTLVQCDDSINHSSSFTNSVTEVYLDDDSALDHYKLQNLNDNSTLVNSTFFHQQTASHLSTNSISLNGGLIRNNVSVKLNGEHSMANVYGVYLMDKRQHIDNQVYVDHAVPNCYSNELYKGILDDHATGVFNGHITVRKDAQKTNAFQNNKNILLTDTARINTKPFLEIYADDVKCSHGATVGQLDYEAMFYLRSRGINEQNSRMLLMYAFAADVINKISIESLKVRIDDMVKKRLRGELSICDQCVLHCSTPAKEINFDIDLSKI